MIASAGWRGWRVFPWDRLARPGSPGSPRWAPPPSLTAAGRFAVPEGPSVLYLAASPEGAVGERLQALRGFPVEPADLDARGRPLSLVSLEIPAEWERDFVDLIDPQVLVARGVTPDRCADHRREVTHAIAAAAYADGARGIRSWSALTGAWHTAALFVDRCPLDAMVFGLPEPLALDHPAVVQAAEVLGMELAA